jgi:two-component system response regulator FixJ
MDFPARVYLVDDDAAVRDGICTLLGSVHLEAVAYDSAESFLQFADLEVHGCLLLDVRMPGMGGLELQRILKERGVELPIIMITGYGDVSMAVRAMKAGAADFIEKPCNGQELLDAIRACLIADAEAHQRRSRHKAAVDLFSRLTQREFEVLRLLAAGNPSKRIASKLAISEHTVDVHRFNLMHKLEVRTLAELIHLCAALPTQPAANGD